MNKIIEITGVILVLLIGLVLIDPPHLSEIALKLHLDLSILDQRLLKGLLVLGMFKLGYLLVKSIKTYFYFLPTIIYVVSSLVFLIAIFVNSNGVIDKSFEYLSFAGVVTGYGYNAYLIGKTKNVKVTKIKI